MNSRKPENPTVGDVLAVRCRSCLDRGFACEDHPSFPWEGTYGPAEGHAEHGGIGMPCPACCSPVPQDGTHDIAEAFTPDWMRDMSKPPCEGTGITEDDGDDVAQYRGVIAIEWPAATRPGPYSSMAGCLLVITDLVTGKQIMTCSHADVTVHADAAALVTADLVLFADADGEPLLDGMPETDDSGNVRTGVFPFLVGEMRVGS